MTGTASGEWQWDTQRHSLVLLIQTLDGPGTAGARAWCASDGVTSFVPMQRLIPLAAAPLPSAETVATIASTARINDAISRNMLLAPLDVPVIPLPHQIAALQRATARDPVRLLLADEVGLGKTIEAGLVIRELILRGDVRRVLVVAPKGLVGQWVAEMRIHFDLAFELLLPSDFAAHHRNAGDANLWRRFDRVVTAMDSIKPLAAREGWSAQQLARHNRDRFEALIAAGWDLIVVDEAHRLAGATDGVARYALGQGLTGAASRLLLLSATPHSGKSDAFHRLMALIDERAFPDLTSVTRERVAPYVVRTEKRAAVNADGSPLFVPRMTRSLPVTWGATHRDEQDLYDAVTEYVREGYNRAISERRFAVGFLMILYQRLVTSSTRAIRAALERRLSAIGGALIPTEDGEDEESTGEQILARTARAAPSEEEDVASLIALARRTEVRAPDAKAEALLELLVDLEREELDPGLKALVFTEFTATQAMLAEFFMRRGYGVALLNGSMDLDERRSVQQAFAGETRILISTEAGGEGLNLQFCHIVVNYDLPWNPMRIEQRIGRVDRIGQRKPVRAFNLSLEASVEHRMREVLERKLNQILTDLGVDKLGDVLDSSDIEADFDDAYVASLLRPDDVEQHADALVNDVARRARDTHAGTALLRGDAPIDIPATRAVLEHPLTRWLETLTLNGIKREGGAVVPHLASYDCTWADGEHWAGISFDRANLDRGAERLVTLAEPRLQALLARGWRYMPGLPIARTSLSGLVSGVEGVWSLWQLTATAAERTYRRYFPLFLHANGRLFVPSARHIWDVLARPDAALTILGRLDESAADTAWEQLAAAAHREATASFQGVGDEHSSWIEAEREKAAVDIASRRARAAKVGLASVREHRLDELAAEEASTAKALSNAKHLMTEVSALLLIHIEPADA